MTSRGTCRPAAFSGPPRPARFRGVRAPRRGPCSMVRVSSSPVVRAGRVAAESMGGRLEGPVPSPSTVPMTAIKPGRRRSPAPAPVRSRWAGARSPVCPARPAAKHHPPAPGTSRSRLPTRTSTPMATNPGPVHTLVTVGPGAGSPHGALPAHGVGDETERRAFSSWPRAGRRRSPFRGARKALLVYERTSAPAASFPGPSSRAVVPHDQPGLGGGPMRSRGSGGHAAASAAQRGRRPDRRSRGPGRADPRVPRGLGRISTIEVPPRVTPPRSTTTGSAREEAPAPAGTARSMVALAGAPRCAGPKRPAFRG